MQYQYQLIFKLSAREVAAEPLPQFFTNLYIHSQMKQKQIDEAKSEELKEKLRNG